MNWALIGAILTIGGGVLIALATAYNAALTRRNISLLEDERLSDASM
jgi:hypothetical protein